MSRLTRAEKEALLSIAQRGWIAHGGGIEPGIKDTEMISRLVRKRMLRKAIDGTPTRVLTRNGRLAVKRFEGREFRLSGNPWERSRANPKVGRSHIARRFGYDGYGGFGRLDELDPEMRP
jgi:hypothetical protein